MSSTKSSLAFSVENILAEKCGKKRGGESGGCEEAKRRKLWKKEGERKRVKLQFE